MKVILKMVRAGLITWEPAREKNWFVVTIVRETADDFEERFLNWLLSPKVKIEK